MATAPAPNVVVYNPAFVSRHFSVLVVAAGLTFFLGLGRGAIGDSDEAFYAEAAREMVESGDWLTPYYNYELRFQKPILYYWLAAGAFVIGGVSEAAARLPAALSGLGLVLLAWHIGRRWLGEEQGFVAGLVVATNFGYYVLARMALPDLPLAFFVTMSTWAGIESVAAGRCRQPVAARHWLLLAAIAAALAVLTKGPVGLVLPAAVTAAALACRRAEGEPWWPWRTADLLLGAAVCLAVAAPWYLAMAREHGVGYLHHFFVGENVERFATDRYNEPRPVWFYLPVVLGGLLPWSPFTAPWVRSGWLVLRRRLTASRELWWLALWAAIPLAFYSVSIGKQPRYVLPMLPPLALLLAHTLHTRMTAADPGSQRTLRWCAAGSALVLLVFGALLQRGKPLLFALDPTTGVIATTVILLAGLALLALAWAHRPAWVPVGIAATSIATLLSLHYSVYTVADAEPVQRMASLVNAHRAGVSASGTYRVFVRNLVFYTGMRQTDLTDLTDLRDFLGRSDHVLAVAREEDLVALERTHGISPRRLASVTYFNPAAVRVRTLLQPNPEEDLETVWLVSNR